MTFWNESKSHERIMQRLKHTQRSQYIITVCCRPRHWNCILRFNNNGWLLTLFTLPTKIRRCSSVTKLWNISLTDPTAVVNQTNRSIWIDTAEQQNRWTKPLRHNRHNRHNSQRNHYALDHASIKRMKLQRWDPEILNNTSDSKLYMSHTTGSKQDQSV